MSSWAVLFQVMCTLYVMVGLIFAKEAPEDYMDEIFHVTQCQAYCAGRFSYWDPMITTFPGLYYAALVLLLLPAGIKSAVELEPLPTAVRKLCQTGVLRVANIALSLACLLLFRAIAADVRVQHLSSSGELSSERVPLETRPSKEDDLGGGRKLGAGNAAKRRPSKSKSTAHHITYIDGEKETADLQTSLRRPALEDDLKAITLALYPPHFFFAFLFYTDVGSTAAVAAMYLAALRRKFGLAALLAVVAIFFRQTNVIWALFVTCVGATDMLWPLSSWSKASPALEPVSPLALWLLAERAWTRRREVLLTFGPLVLVIAAFIAFAVHNGGIVLGAKDAHQMSLHVPQFFYCLSFLFCAFAPVQLRPAHVSSVWAYVNRHLRSAPGKSLALAAVALLGGLLAVHYFTIEHPYLLADNRHYPFYLWRWIYKRHVAVKYWLVPLYLYAALSLVLSLAKTQRPLWIFFYLVATFGVLVPAPLIEFRYFNVPFFLAAFHIPMPLARQRPTLLLQILLFAVIDVGAVYLFLRRTFEWPHEEGTQRFMW